MAIYFGLSIKTFEVIVISVFKFLVTCLVSKILKGYSHSPSRFIIRSILKASQAENTAYAKLIR